MSTGWGMIAIYEVSMKPLKDLCDEYENKGWFYDYVILSNGNEWSSIFDENMEWGNVDIYVQHIFANLGTIILTVEYYDDIQLRYRLWKNGVCIAEYEYRKHQKAKSIADSAKIFAKELKSDIVSKILTIKDIGKNIMLMECMLQCQLSKHDCQEEGDKIQKAIYYPKEYLDEYFKEQLLASSFEIHDLSTDYSINVLLDQSGEVLSVCSEELIVLQQENNVGVLYSINKEGNIKKEFDIPLNLLGMRFCTKAYFGNGMFGFLSKHDAFTVYRQDGSLTIFPDIRMSIYPRWHAYMPDYDTIFMEWACYNINTGEKEWDFPLPIKKDAYQNFISFEMWNELPNGMFLLQVNVDQMTLYLAIMNRQGKIKKTLKLNISYQYYHLDIIKDSIWLMKKSSGTNLLNTIIVMDFNLRVVGEYDIIGQLIHYNVCVDSRNENFYILTSDSITRFCLKDGEKKEYSIPYKDIKIDSWGMLSNDLIYIITTKCEFLLFDSHKELACIFKFKMTGFFIRAWSTDDERIILASQSIKGKKKVVLQEIVRT